MAAVLGEVDDQLHIATFSRRSEFWEKLKLTDLLASVCTSLEEIYVAVYTKCGKGKDKFLHFQLEWYKRCSFMLHKRITDVGTDAEISSCTAD